MITLPKTRSHWLLYLITLGLISGILLSQKLWLTERLFPHFPVWQAIGPLPTPYDLWLLTGFLCILMGSAILKSRIGLAAAVLLMIWLALQDQMRWQPWYYQYLLMLGVFAFSGLKRDSENSTEALKLQQIIVIMVYVWGGIHKCHPGFMLLHEQVMIAPLLEKLNDGWLSQVLIKSGYTIPWIEIGMGAALAFRKTRNLGILLALGTHLIILLLLGTVKGYYSNSVVWPWNMIMVAMVLCLFYRSDLQPFPKMRWSHMSLPAIAVCLLMIIAPIFYYFDKWDRYLAFNLYSAQQRRMLVRIDPLLVWNFPKELDAYCIESDQLGRYKALSIIRWSYSELNVPLISERRILKQLSQELCALDNSKQGMLFYIHYPHIPENPNALFNCTQLDSIKIP